MTLLVAAVVGVVLVVALLFVVGGNDDDPNPAAGEDPTTTVAPLVTSPILTDDEFVTDMLAVGVSFSPLATADENACAARSIVIAMGGAAALRTAGIDPEQLTETFGLRGEVVPAAAIDTYLATAAGCGLDAAEVVFFRPARAELGPEATACIEAGLDRAGLNRTIAAYLLDPNRSSTTFLTPAELALQISNASSDCL